MSRPLELTQEGKMTKAEANLFLRNRSNKKAKKDRVHGRVIEDLVAGILMNGPQFLVEKRRDDEDADPGYIEIPGGHVNKDETLEDALRREMREELGIDVEKAVPVHKDLYTATNGERGRIHYFYIEKWKGKIVSNEAEKVYWESSVSNLTILPDKRAVRGLLRGHPHTV